MWLWWILIYRIGGTPQKGVAFLRTKFLLLTSPDPHFGTSFFYFRGMITHYCQTQEDALKKAKQAGRQEGCEYWGINVSGKKGFAVYKNGKLVERYMVF